MVKTTAIGQRLREVDRKFKTSCQQVRVLDRQMDILQSRYKKAKVNKTRAAFNSFRLQLSTLEGVREAFYLYACDRAAERSRLREDMRRELSRTTEE
jgi:hypothetical protein